LRNCLLSVPDNLHLTLAVPWQLEGCSAEASQERFQDFVRDLSGIRHLRLDAGTELGAAEGYLTAAHAVGLPVGLVVSVGALTSRQLAYLLPLLHELVLHVQYEDDPETVQALVDRARMENVKISVQLNCVGLSWQAWWPVCEAALEGGGRLSFQAEPEGDPDGPQPGLRALHHTVHTLRQRYPGVPIQVEPLLRAEILQHPCIVGACTGTHCHSGGHNSRRPYFVYISRHGEIYPEFPKVGPAFAVGHVMDASGLAPILGDYAGLEGFPTLFRFIRYVFQTYVARGKTPFVWWRRALQAESKQSRWRQIQPLTGNSYACITPGVVLREDDKGCWTVVNSDSTEGVHVSINDSMHKVLTLCDGQHSIDAIVSILKERHPTIDRSVTQPLVVSSLDHLQTMGMIQVHRGPLGQPTPVPRVERVMTVKRLAVEVTGACNFSCWHCYANAGHRWIGELDTQALCTVLRRYALAGCRAFLFTGGEPLLRPDLTELVRYTAQDLGMRNNTLSTNGSLLTPTLIEQIRPFLASVTVSLDGPQPVHDAMRGLGAYERTMGGLEHLQKADMSFRLQFSVTRSSWPYLPWIFERATELGAREVVLVPVLFTGRGAVSCDDLLPREQLGALYEATTMAGVAHPDGPRFATPLYTLAELEEQAEVLRRTWFPAMLPDGTIVPQSGLGKEWTLAVRGGLIPLESPSLARFRDLVNRAIDACRAEAQKYRVAHFLHMVYTLAQHWNREEELAQV